jgi:hypothetical protein
MRVQTTILLSLTILVGFCITPINADVLTLRQGVDGYEHLGAYIKEGGGFASTNYGASPQWLLGWHSSQLTLRDVMAFDLSTLPKNAVITGITLAITTDAAGTGTIGEVELHQVTGTVTMLEGNGGLAGSQATDGVTWGRPRVGTPWITAGGDFSTTVLSIISGFDTSIVHSEKTFLSSASFISVAQDSYNSSKPLEMILLSPTTESSGITAFARIASDDNATIAYRPILTIAYDVIPEPASVSCLLLALSTIILRRREM